MAPFVWLGRLYGWLRPLKQSTNTFLFFSSADIGGAPQVNLDIVHCIRDQNPVIVFSKKPKNNGFLEQFRAQGVQLIDLHTRIDNKLFHFVNFFYRGVIASWIARSPKPVVFGGECLFFYKIIPHVPKRTYCVELCHLDTWLPYSIGQIPHIDLRVFSTRELLEKVRRQYRENNLPATLEEKLYFTDNSIPIPDVTPVHNEKLEVAFIGRGAPQKRVHLVAGIAEKLQEAGAPVHVSFIGDVEKVIDITRYPYCTFYGNISDQQKMQDIYRSTDVLLLTSAYEGLPVVVMMMMAYSKVVVSTAINGIPDYIRHGENGLLITETSQEGIIRQGTAHLQTLAADNAKRRQLGQRSREIALEKFSYSVFCRAYRTILIDQQKPQS